MQRHEFQAKPRTALGMTNHGIRPDFSLPNEKVQACGKADCPGVWSLDEQPTETQVADQRNVFSALALPAHPHISSGIDTGTQSPGGGVSGPQGVDSDRSGHLVLLARVKIRRRYDSCVTER